MPITCPDCRTPNRDNAFSCNSCGLPFSQAPLSERLNPPKPLQSSGYSPVTTQGAMQSPAALSSQVQPSYQPMAKPSGFMAFCQVLGLHPMTAVVVFAVDWMLFGKEFITGGLSWPISILVAVVLSVGTFLVQKHMYKDDDGSALAKAVMLGLLTAIPTALPGFLTAPSGFLGLIKVIKGGDNNA